MRHTASLEDSPTPNMLPREVIESTSSESAEAVVAVNSSFPSLPYYSHLWVQTAGSAMPTLTETHREWFAYPLDFRRDHA
jgi:hypothetical protein